MSATLQQRVTGILTTPQTEWLTIAGEADSVQGLYTRYILPLAAIGPLALLLRGSPRLAVLQYLIQLVWLFVCAKVLEWLAPKFNSGGDTTQALKLVAYASTPGWLAGIANLLPWVGGLVVLVATIYDIYLFYLGLTPVMKTPGNQVIPFMLVAAIVMIVVFIALGFITGPLLIGGMLMGG